MKFGARIIKAGHPHKGHSFLFRLRIALTLLLLLCATDIGAQENSRTFSEGQSAKDNCCLELKITTSSNYSENDPIAIRGTLTNRCDNSIRLKNRYSMGADILISLQDSTDRIFPLLPPAPPPPLRQGDFIDLGSNLYIDFEVENIQHHLSEKLTSGDYELFVLYFPLRKREVISEHLQGGIVSNTVNFKIVNKEG